MSNGELPADVHADSNCRLALPERDQLDERARAYYDRLTDPNTISQVGLQGPGGIFMHSPVISEHTSGLNSYYLSNAVLDGATGELAVLVVAREVDSRFVWAAHEPVAVTEGVPAATIDVVRRRKATGGLDEKERVIIEFGRQLFRERRVDADKYAAAQALFGDRGMVDFVFVMTHYLSVAHVLAAFDMQPKPGLESTLPVD